MFKAMSIKGKLLSGFCLVILLALTIGVIAIYSMVQAQKVGKDIYTLVNGDVQKLYQVHQAYNAVHSWLHKLQVAPTPELVAEGLRQTEQLAQVVTILPNVGGLGSELTGNLNSLVATIQSDFAAQLRAGQFEQADKTFLKDVLPHSSAANTNLSKMIYAQEAIINKMVVELDMTGQIYTTLGCTIASVVLGLVISFLLYSYILSSTLRIRDYAVKLEHGDFNLAIDPNSVHRDEIGQIILAFHSTAKTLNRAVARTIAISQALNKNADSLNSACAAVITGSKDTESRALTIASAADEMVSTTSNIANNCRSAQVTSEDAKNDTNTGMEKVRATVMRIKEQAEVTREDAAKVFKLAEQSQSIGSIVATIEDIAAQTNLLALNAAIEAARAGEAGRGFAVVADEVRALASRTAQSTKEISGMVASVRADSEAATSSINASIEQMNAVADEASDLEKTLSTLRESVNNVNTQVVQISTSATQQIDATTEISSNMQNITEVAQQSVDVASNADRVANYCRDLINGLLHELDFFKLDDRSLSQEDLHFKRIDKDGHEVH